VVLVERRPERGAEPRHRHVLDADGEPAQRARRLSAREPSLQLAGVVQGARVQRHDRVDDGVVTLEPREAGLDGLDRRHGSSADEPPELGRRQVR